MRVFGARLRTVLSRSVEKKPLAFCAGIGVTALVQSSNATTMLVTSFVAQDLVALTPALVIVLGADVGTALMARILTFDLSWLSPRSEEHTSELQSRENLVCRLLLEKKKTI